MRIKAHLCRRPGLRWIGRAVAGLQARPVSCRIVDSDSVLVYAQPFVRLAYVITPTREGATGVD